MHQNAGKEFYFSYNMVFACLCFQTARGFFSLAISVCRFSQDAHSGVDYFSSEVIFGPSGVEGVKPVPRMNASEKALLDAARHLEILS